MIEVTPEIDICSSCGEPAHLISAEPEEKWPRQLVYLCPNGHRIQMCQVTDPRTMPPPEPTNPHLPRMTIFHHPSLEGDVELFQIVGNLRKKIGRNRKLNPVHSYMNSLEQYVNSAIIQFYRFKQLGFENNKYPTGLGDFTNPLRKPGRDVPEKIHKLMQIMQQRFIDLHFYLIATDKIEKHLRHLKSAIKLLSVGSDASIWREERKKMENSFEFALDGHKAARNHLEHIEKDISEGITPELEFEETPDIVFSFSDHNGKNRINIDVSKIIVAFNRFVDWMYLLPDIDHYR